MNNRTLLVGRIPLSTTTRELGELFSRHGTIEALHMVTDNQTGSSRGFAFVAMGSQAEAEAATSQLNGHTLNGIALTVIVANPRHQGEASQPVLTCSS